MYKSSSSRIRLIMTAVCLFCVFLLSMIIMGTVGLNGNVSFQNAPGSGCLLYMTVNGKVPSFNSTYCQFPIIGAGVISVFTLLFLGYWAAVIQRYEECAPNIVSQVFMGFSIIMAMMAFAICGEIGIGLNIACRTTSPGQSLSQCMTVSNFQALYTAQVCAGLLGGFYIVALVLEYVQFKKRPEYDTDPYNTQGQQYHDQQSSSEYNPSMSQVQQA